MEFDKRKYTRKEVELMFNAYSGEYQKRFMAQRERVEELLKENAELRTSISVLEEKQTLISDTLLRTERIASDIKKQAEAEYFLELERLKKFSKQWDEYFNRLKEKYPLYERTRKAIELKETVDNSEGLSPEEVIKNLDKMLDDTPEEFFDPKGKIRDYIAATGDNGFNLDDVLNPGKLELEDLCKELGLIDSNE